MPRDERKAWLIRERPDQGWDTRLDVRRLALTWGQYTRRRTRPRAPMPGTGSTPKSTADESWELDALEPTVLGQLVRDQIVAILDHDRWDAAMERENAGAARLEAVTKRWPEIEELVG